MISQGLFNAQTYECSMNTVRLSRLTQKTGLRQTQKGDPKRRPKKELDQQVRPLGQSSGRAGIIELVVLRARRQLHVAAVVVARIAGRRSERHAALAAAVQLARRRISP